MSLEAICLDLRNGSFIGSLPCRFFNLKLNVPPSIFGIDFWKTGCDHFVVISGTVVDFIPSANTVVSLEDGPAPCSVSHYHHPVPLVLLYQKSKTSSNRQKLVDNHFQQYALYQSWRHCVMTKLEACRGNHTRVSAFSHNIPLQLYSQLKQGVTDLFKRGVTVNLIMSSRPCSGDVSSLLIFR